MSACMSIATQDHLELLWKECLDMVNGDEFGFVVLHDYGPMVELRNIFPMPMFRGCISRPGSTVMMNVLPRDVLIMTSIYIKNKGKYDTRLRKLAFFAKMVEGYDKKMFSNLKFLYVLFTASLGVTDDQFERMFPGLLWHFSFSWVENSLLHYELSKGIGCVGLPAKQIKEDGFSHLFNNRKLKEKAKCMCGSKCANCFVVGVVEVGFGNLLENEKRRKQIASNYVRYQHKRLCRLPVTDTAPFTYV